MALSDRKLILASASPRRQGLLAAAGVSFTVVAPDVDETPLPGEAPEDLVLRLARQKAESIAARSPDAVILAADTIVVLDGQVMNKPVDAGDAIRMLQLLQGREHTVLTGFALSCRTQQLSAERVVRTTVTFRPIGPEEIRCYVESGEPLDKAGAYAAQGGAQIFIRSISGSYTNVVGLPLTEVIEELASAGLWVPELLHRAPRNNGAG